MKQLELKSEHWSVVVLFMDVSIICSSDLINVSIANSPCSEYEIFSQNSVFVFDLIRRELDQEEILTKITPVPIISPPFSD